MWIRGGLQDLVVLALWFLEWASVIYEIQAVFLGCELVGGIVGIKKRVGGGGDER